MSLYIVYKIDSSESVFIYTRFSMALARYKNMTSNCDNEECSKWVLESVVIPLPERLKLDTTIKDLIASPFTDIATIYAGGIRRYFGGK